MTRHFEGLLSVHSAVLIFGLTALFSKFISLNAIEITLLRSVFAALAIALYILWLKESLLLHKKRDYLIAFLLGFFLCTHWITYFHAMQVSSIAIGIIALYTYPVITVFIEPFFHGERPHIKDILSALVVLVGIYLLVPEFSIDNQTTQGVFWGVLSAFLFAMRNIIHGRFFKSYPARHALLYQTVFVVLFLLPFSGQVVFEVSQVQWWWFIVLGVFFTALPHTLFANSLLYLKAKTVGLIGCMQVVYGTLFAALFLLELPDWKTVVGGLIVISAAVFETIGSVKQGKQAK
ncbi:DMT family transporter [sulfur-oxidizing endosymbiont of Gigantopelta aegis]|uniref:DMT family transporter n=1 Tax=sulfur-oxidizing endosymbiont of Gigantopelta aegis TaxID=2794934 RepID=UPI0018DDDA67|nr:DMT family transporter [sulfur-oxidizing endosymbiont of Gigantopelta aegis]